MAKRARSIDSLPRAKSPPRRGRPPLLILWQSRVPRKLLRAVRAEAKARQVSMTEIAEWALTEYLRGTNPELAEEATGRAVPA